MVVQKLPEEAISKLQSGLIITDAVQCVLELVHNSLDAQATGIAVRLDLKNYQIRVIDNGKGIGREDFEFVGEKFMTSKYHSNDLDSTFPMYGFKGQALSSLIDVCRSLTIETKSEDNGPTLVKMFHNKKASMINESNSERRGTGTTVTVDDFMCSMPVRKKRINEVFDIEEIKNQLQYLAVIHYNVCFTLRNENKGIILLQTPQAANTLEAVSNIFGKTLAKSLKTLYYKENEYEITGLISLKPQFQSKIQLLYVNKRMVTKGMAHKFINNVIKEYVGKYTSLNIFNKDSPGGKVLKSLKRCCHNIFIIKIQCSCSQYELITNIRKTTVEFRNWKATLKYIHKAIKRTYKEVLNLENSSNTPQDENNNEAVVRKKKFGTSVLMNAVKGDPVKRRLSNKKNRKQKKKILNEMSNDLCTLQPRNKKRLINQSVSDCSYNKEEIDDSLESPIPKKISRHSKFNSKINRSPALTQSFFEFYGWIKSKVETDKNAFNLFHDFLQYKNGVNPSTQQPAAQLNSPVVGGKLKKRKMKSPDRRTKKKERKQNKPDYLSVLNEEIPFEMCQQPKIFPNSCLRIKKAVQFTTQMSPNFCADSNFGTVGTEMTSMFKEPFNLSSLSKLPSQKGPNQTLSSLSSSLRPLSNVIEFRNWSESFFEEHSNNIRIDTRNDYTFASAAGTWASHYQDIITKSVRFTQGRSDLMPFYEENLIQSNEKRKNFLSKNTLRNEWSVEFTKQQRSKAFHDAQIQVNMPQKRTQKENAVAQTSLTDSIIPDTFGFKCDDLVSRGICRMSRENAEDDHTNLTEANKLSQEVLKPSFYEDDGTGYPVNSLGLFNDPDKTTTKVPTPLVMNEKNSTSSEFFCGQKTNSNTKPQNETTTSKETHTIAAIWADSLTEIINVPTETDSNLKSGSTLPKTIPLEEIDCNFLRPIETKFSLVERHDFIPKGLSPTFFNTETSKTFTLSPGEKNKLRATVDNTRNDLLETVKWQDESTGDYMKPALPDQILDEMRLKAEKSIMNFENSILSASLSYCAVKVHNLLHSFAFTKELLSGVEVLGQLDKKFIVTKMKLVIPKKMELISLFDQHAVDERIKLEELIRDYTSPDGKFISSRLNPSVKCTLNESDVRVVSESNKKLLKFGLDIKAVNENTVSINEIPTFLLNKHAKDLKNKKDVSLSEALKVLIVNVVDEMRETRGALSKIPKVMHSVFCSEACHKAIRFNRALSTESMNEMISKLKCCKLPFQCAHGRPSVIPIIDLEDFQSVMKETESVELEKIKKFLYQSSVRSVQERSNTM